MIKILAACGAGVNSSHQIKMRWKKSCQTVVMMCVVTL